MQTKRRIWGIKLLAVILTVASLTGCPGDVVVFQDPALESAVRSAIGRPFGLLSRADLLDAIHVDARGLGIRSLIGIEFCTNLVGLDLDTNAVSDLTPLENLAFLRELNLDSNEVSNLAPLAGLVELDFLSSFNNQVADIQALVTNSLNGGLGEGDQVILDSRTLSEQALTIDVPLLEAAGVNVVLVTSAEGGEA